MDQGLFATSNFALNILLARWLTLEEYGAFALAFAVFLLVGSLHQAVLTEPMLVFGPGKYRNDLSEYLGTLVYGHWLFATLGSLIFLLAGLGLAFWGSKLLSSVFLGLALAEPFILFLWLMRRMCYARLKPQLASSGGALYMILMLAGAYGLYEFQWLSAASALGVMGVSSTVVALWLVKRLDVRSPRTEGKGSVRNSLQSHWTYGRWSVMNQASSWAPVNLPFLLLPVWVGLEAGASFKALMNLLMPVLQAVSALSVLLLPVLVQAREQSKFSFQVRVALILFVSGSTVYWVLLGAFHDPLVLWLYGGQYTEYAGLLWLLGFMPAVVAVKLVMSQALKALERPDRLFIAYMFSDLAFLPVGAACIYVWGLTGAVVSLLISQGVAAVLTAVLLLGLSQRSSTSSFMQEAEENT